jgi:hypothetical protein
MCVYVLARKETLTYKERMQKHGVILIEEGKAHIGRLAF